MEQRERVSTFEDMKVWQESHALVLKTFEQTLKLPEDQQDGLALTIERAAVDVPRFIAEGFRRRGSRNKAHYYNMAQSALEGLRYYFILCRDLKFGIDYDDLSYRGDQVARMLDGLVRSMSRGPRDGGRGRGGGGRGRGPRRDSYDDRGGEGDGGDMADPGGHDDDFGDA
jgi:four helix bundle protein